MKCALVIGCSADFWKEVEAAQALCAFDAVYCVKLAGVHWQGGPFVWATLHPEFMDDYEKQRRDLGLHSDYEIVAPLPGEVALDDGFDRVVLAGVPMVGSARHFIRGKEWLSRDSFTVGFKESVKHFNG